ncbi:amyloid fiber anchoring/assembly protein TapA [Halalkalibacter krulwichiae]|uniref:Amyloid fiber anchoring/assembly protein TapA n=1 Tax=Halalkalibacter krulwichiae TaxID=199441 RepID=A0A1X9M651_9BACI|nr:amyloid fiber anchoring/assembly protein TapA [Halalkalibacter krulwichiae]ARK28919.1 hypothetical protein BkAM31D_03065 [Halalkalibacter krulwichiae]
MRSLRSRKYRKKYKKLIILAQVLAIWYAFVISTAMVTSDTFAFFSASDSTTIAITTGKWWDGSELEFVERPNTKNIKACAPYQLEIEVRNKGYQMGSETEYEIYYVDNGSPKQNGERVSEGVIKPLGEKESTILTYEALENGSYMFKVFQVRGYEDDFERREEIWSTKYMVKCLEEDDEEEEELEMDEVVEDEKEEIDQPEVKEQPEEEKATEVETGKTDNKVDEKKEEEQRKSPVEEEPKEELIEQKESVVEDKVADEDKAEAKEVMKLKKVEEESPEEGDES